MIVHILRIGELEKAEEQGWYEAESLSKQGFIHCSQMHQIIRVANANYKGVEDMVMLVINEEKVKSAVVYEDLYNEGQEFPHIYGTLNLSAVEKVIAFPCNADGTFSLPPEAELYTLKD